MGIIKDRYLLHFLRNFYVGCEFKLVFLHKACINIMGTQKFVDGLGLVKQTASEISIASRLNFHNENVTEVIYFKLAFSEPVCSKKTKKFKT